jgi:hypothetical protein
MRWPGFIGPSNAAPSLIANCERTVNLYPAATQSPFAPAGAVLMRTPGRRSFYNSSDFNGRAALAVDGRAFVVIGTSFLELDATQAATLRGTVTQDENPATISYNGKAGDQLLICSGTNGYCYDMTAHTFTQVLTGDAVRGDMIDGRFLAFDSATGRVRFSAVNDGTSWDALDFFERRGADPCQAMIVRGEEIWLIGEHTGEVWYDAGDQNDPFAPIQGATFQYGTPAPWSVAKAGDFLVWLSQDKDGGGVIVAAKGYGPQPISSLSVAAALSTYRRDSTIDDCEVMVYQEDQHTFACFSFPTAGATWVTDISTEMAWHERGVWDSAAGRYRIWGPRAHAYAFGKHLVVSRSSAVVAELDRTISTELNGSGVRWLRIPPPIWAKTGERIVVSRLQVIAEPGLGLTSGQGSDPQIMLRTSKDAKTWGAERTASVGKIGEYAKQCIFTRCGSSDVLFAVELSGSDPIPFRLSSLEVEGTGINTDGQQRAA